MKVTPLVFVLYLGTGDLRPCAESLEIELAVEKSGNSYPASETEMRGNKWYRFYDGGSKNYLKVI